MNRDDAYRQASGTPHTGDQIKLWPASNADKEVQEVDIAEGDRDFMSIKLLSFFIKKKKLLSFQLKMNYFRLQPRIRQLNWEHKTTLNWSFFFRMSINSCSIYSRLLVE